MSTLRVALMNLPGTIRSEWLNVSEVDLNDISVNENVYDDTLSLRKKCIEAGFHLMKIRVAYHIGWEMDNFEMLAKKSGRDVLITTSHGKIEYKGFE